MHLHPDYFWLTSCAGTLTWPTPSLTSPTSATFKCTSILTAFDSPAVLGHWPDRHHPWHLLQVQRSNAPPSWLLLTHQLCWDIDLTDTIPDISYKCDVQMHLHPDCFWLTSCAGTLTWPTPSLTSPTSATFKCTSILTAFDSPAVLGHWPDRHHPWHLLQVSALATSTSILTLLSTHWMFWDIYLTDTIPWHLLQVWRSLTRCTGDIHLHPDSTINCAATSTWVTPHPDIYKCLH